jgi:hypothetical protein
MTAPPRYIEIETSRLCNRRCGWCPNGLFETRREQELMPWELYQRVVREIGELGFAGWLALHNYNEPLLNSRLLREIAEAREAIPRGVISIFTNGDYLSRQMLDDLWSAGTGYLRVTLYPPNTAKSIESTTDAATRQSRLARWLHAKGLDALGAWSNREVRQGTAAVLKLDQLTVEVISPDLGTYNWRGGTAPLVLGAIRSAPCNMTCHSASIDYRGRLKMCCNVFADADDHSPYVVGTLATETFQQLWNNERLSRWRELHSRADWTSSPICQMCTHHPREYE